MHQRPHANSYPIAPSPVLVSHHQQPAATAVMPPTDNYTPVEVARMFCEAGIRKSKFRLDELMIKAFYGGCT